jgi:hypothetical protein
MSNFISHNLHPPPSGHSVYTYQEMQEALKKVFPDSKFVNEIESFAKFADSLKQDLKIASTMPGDFLPHHNLKKYCFLV